MMYNKKTPVLIWNRGFALYSRLNFAVESGRMENLPGFLFGAIFFAISLFVELKVKLILRRFEE